MYFYRMSLNITCASQCGLFSGWFFFKFRLKVKWVFFARTMEQQVTTF